MKAQIEGMRPGEPVIMDDEGRRTALVLRLVPESPEEVAELKRFLPAHRCLHFRD